MKNKFFPSFAILVFLAPLIDGVLVFLHLAIRGNFDLDQEQNFPTGYQSLKLAFLALVCTYILFKKKFAFWFLLILGFAYLSLDEWFQIHEYISNVIYLFLLEANMVVSFSSWILVFVPIGIISLLLLLVLGKRVKKDDPETFHPAIINYFILGCILFCLVPVVEIIGTWGWNLDGEYYQIAVAIEEGLELFGASSFLIFVIAQIQRIYSDEKISKKDTVNRR